MEVPSELLAAWTDRYGVKLIGLLLFAYGAVSVARGERVARFEEQLDSIGSERSWSEVEPSDWKVAVTEILGVLIAMVGFVVLVLG